MELTRTMRVNKWGNSLGIRFPSEFVNLVNLQEKSLVEIKAVGEQLVITKVEKEEPRKRMTLAERLKMYPLDGFLQEEEIDWGEPVGDEVW